jgi:hypothetical protein
MKPLFSVLSCRRQWPKEVIGSQALVAVRLT